MLTHAARARSPKGSKKGQGSGRNGQSKDIAIAMSISMTRPSRHAGRNRGLRRAKEFQIEAILKNRVIARSAIIDYNEAPLYARYDCNLNVQDFKVIHI